MKVRFIALLLFISFSYLAAAEEDNKIIICQDSLDMVRWDIEFIRHAKHSIDASVCFFGGEVARKFLEEIEFRLAVCNDLQVHVLASHFLMEQEDYKCVERVLSKYPNNFHIEYAEIITAFSPDVGGYDNHIKALVVDEKYFSFGGTNIYDTQHTDGTKKEVRKKNKNVLVPGGFRNQDVVGSGPIAKQIRETICQAFALWHHYRNTSCFEKDLNAFIRNKYYFPVKDKPHVEKFDLSNRLIKISDNQIRLIKSGPHQSSNMITDEYISLIRKAKNEIKIGNLYFFPPDTIFDAIFDAARRGVKITIITNGLGDTTPDMNKYYGWANRIGYLPVFHGRSYHLWEYFSAKKQKPFDVHIYEYNVEDILFHKKWMMVDNHICIIGSYNLGTKSHCFDYETVLVFDSDEIVKESEKMYDIDLHFSKEVTHEEALDWYFNPITSAAGELQKKSSGLI